MHDPYHLQRFIDAQQNVYANVERELRDGRKTSHWMWFIFPQIHGLGSSAIAQRYSIKSLGEARAYVDQPVLGIRLRQCTELVIRVEGRSIEHIFGFPDNRKFQSSMTLFTKATVSNEIFLDALHKYFNDDLDEKTVELLG